jgi:integrase
MGIDDTDDENLRLEALFVLSNTLGLRPGELRQLAWDHVDLNRGVGHVWRSASKTGDMKTPKSKRSLILPKRTVGALKAHKSQARPGTPRSRRNLARQQPRVLPRERHYVGVRCDQLAFLEDDQKAAWATGLLHSGEGGPRMRMRCGSAIPRTLAVRRCGSRVQRGAASLAGSQPPVPHRASHGGEPDRPGVSGPGGFPTRIPQTKRHYAAHRGTAASMA